MSDVLVDKINIEFYLFGSALHSNNANDIDILIVYDTDIDTYKILQLRNALRTQLFHWFKLPIDITLLRRDEERESKFIRREEAEKIFESYLLR